MTPKMAVPEHVPVQPFSRLRVVAYRDGSNPEAFHWIYFVGSAKPVA
jgi:hypothetical protein